MLELLCPIKKNALERPLHPAIITDDAIYTYQKLHQKLDEIVNLLKQKGIQSRQRVAFHAKLSAQTLFLLFALSRMQAAACPISVRLPKEALPEMLDRLQASFYIDIDSLALTYLEGSSNQPFFDKSPLFTILCTSGSTSFAKIVAHSFENFYYSALGSNLSLGLQPNHRWLLSLPLNHVGGIALAFRCFLNGAAIVLSHIPLKESIKLYEVTHLSLVPTQLYRLVQDLQETSLPSLDVILLGGAPIPEEVFNKALKKGLKIFATYGMTEMSSQITMDDPESSLKEITSGIPLPFREVKINAEGEILVRGKTLFQGYWTSEKKLELPLEDGWFATKDTGHWTEDGKLILKGRKDNMFISGGENIYPEVIEKELCELPGIIQALVVPLPDPEFGHRPVALIKEENTNYTLEELRENLRKKLPGFCLPIKMLPMPEIPLGELKINRKKLLEHVVDVVKLST